MNKVNATSKMPTFLTLTQITKPSNNTCKHNFVTVSNKKKTEQLISFQTYNKIIAISFVIHCTYNLSDSCSLSEG